MPKRRKPPSQSWRVFLANHVNELISIDFFTVSTATFRVLFVLVVLAHHRRRALHFNVTGHPTASVGSAADNSNLSGRYGTHYIIASTPYSMDKAVQVYEIKVGFGYGGLILGVDCSMYTTI